MTSRKQNHTFVSDTHFFHEGAIRMCKRPFASVADMNRTLVELWNARVQPKDIVWHLGDFGLGASQQQLAEIFAALNGVKRLVKGNHDKTATRNLPWASPVQDLVETSIDGTRLVLCHYPMRSWRGSCGRTIHLHGHTHDLLPPTTQSCDVGVDSWAYAPVTLDQIKSRLSGVTEEPEDRRLNRLRGSGGPVADEG